MDPLISLNEVSVSYKRSGSIFKRSRYFDALDSICLKIYPGETLGVLGRNGVGKSTLLKIISGIIKPNTGVVKNYGASVSLLALQAGFDPNLSGYDNAVFAGMLQGYSRKDVMKHLDSIKEYSDLGKFFYEPVRTYSTGMRARLGFSISTIISPDVLLIDEVLSVGDQYFREKAERTMVAKIQSEQTVVIVSHSEVLIKRLCDRVVFIENGKIVSEGDPIRVIGEYFKRNKNAAK